ncbi:UNVERIFIED_CONTAM: Beta-amyrin 28-monooxygenase [Sesamum angustifolium]|uniref:Beta-amyrin 28-monooxygenase n=1 Tax=Sesamum angustifolium TaxID=2727405 RepID=A0AAW2PAX5_9LAMI
MEVLAVVLSLLLVVLSLVFISRRRNNGGATLPPGSFGWPILGESVEFLFGKPEKFVGDRMRKYSPDIFKTKILGEKTAVICGPNGHKFLFSNEHKYFTAFRPHPMQHLFRSYKDKAAPPPPPESNASTKRKQSGNPGS